VGKPLRLSFLISNNHLILYIMATKITAAEVNKLRKQTGAGMMDCKKALVEAEGDFEAAVDILRKKGQKVAAKRADRDATEGAVIAKTNGSDKGVIIKLSCETDFVAKNENFVALANKLAELALENGASTKEELAAATFEGSLTIADKLQEQTGVIGEKIEVSELATVNAAYVASYIHMGNKIGTLVGLTAEAAEAGRDVAMQAAAMNPVALNRDAVPQEVIDRELEVGKDLARQEGKPEEMLDKIAMGRLNKFFKENTLVDQDFIKDSKMSVAKYLQSVQSGLEIVDFARVAL
jgi:elongation factor Ts